MAGQSSQLSLKEARAMQERVQHSGSQAKSGGGSANMQGAVKMSGGDSVHRKTKKMMKEC